MEEERNSKCLGFYENPDVKGQELNEQHQMTHSLAHDYYNGADNEIITAYNIYHEFRSGNNWDQDYELVNFSDYYHGVYDTTSDAAEDIYDAEYADLPYIMQGCIDWHEVGDRLYHGEDDAYIVYEREVPGFGTKYYIFNNG